MWLPQLWVETTGVATHALGALQAGYHYRYLTPLVTKGGGLHACLGQEQSFLLMGNERRCDWFPVQSHGCSSSSCPTLGAHLEAGNLISGTFVLFYFILFYFILAYCQLPQSPLHFLGLDIEAQRSKVVQACQGRTGTQDSQTSFDFGESSSSFMSHHSCLIISKSSPTDSGFHTAALL